jgi:hypothetical protein
VLNFLFDNREERASIPSKGIIDSASNLSSDILKEMLTTIGIDYSVYQLKSVVIDIKLLKNRNEIAHGQYIELEKEEFDYLFVEIDSIMESIKNNISNAAIGEKYRRGRQ